ncbi:MAG: terminus macrodomain insulation protein YfbV [Aestuariibacter sp.]
MAHTIGSVVRDGQDYMKIWPLQKQLFSLFPDGQIIMATQLGLKIMPAFAVISAAILLNTNGSAFLPQAITVAAFFLSLPFQGLLWLGYRSNKPLPPSVKGWYRDIHQKMREQGCQLQAVKARPRYKELASLLRTAFDELDKVFTKQWF